jgi:hypothetical protein
MRQAGTAALPEVTREGRALEPSPLSLRIQPKREFLTHKCEQNEANEPKR